METKFSLQRNCQNKVCRNQVLPPLPELPALVRTVFKVVREAIRPHHIVLGVDLVGLVEEAILVDTNHLKTQNEIKNSRVNLTCVPSPRNQNQELFLCHPFS